MCTRQWEVLIVAFNIYVQEMLQQRVKYGREMNTSANLPVCGKQFNRSNKECFCHNLKRAIPQAVHISNS